MSKLLHHFIFRVNQVFRVLNFNPRASVPVVFVLALFIFIELPQQEWMAMLSLFLVTAFHFSRKDIKFLKKVLPTIWWMVIIFETSILYLLPLVINIHYQLHSQTLLCLIPILIFPFIKARQTFSLPISWTIIPDPLFEWKSFLRRTTILFFIVYGIVIASGFHKAIFIFTGLFVLEYVSYIFEPNEPKEMLQLYFKKYTFIEKLKHNVFLYNLLLVPAYIVFIINHTASFETLLFYILVMNMYLLLTISRKYKLYHHSKKTNQHSIAVAIEHLFLSITIIPALFVIKNNSKKAKVNIAGYVGN
ncbi:hypothetical protein MVI27_00325 [Chryseobacterium salipaludis]|uniref:hypothetical protein n=1 Tax=Chryseobacterium TaxID=59732 RepID=UPI001FF426DC|nr:MULTISPECIES: hypothetical protein [Chryseobacterium]MCJ8496702.1 hypothetical protein [Chryseobacterium salipaludis]MCX3296183.1 hypothetical protein [Planobacterium sp. JC490]